MIVCACVSLDIATLLLLCDPGQRNPTLQSCPDLPMECVFQCGEHIARKMTKQHCQQQCDNAKRITSQQQDDKFVITCIAVQETDEQ